MTAKAKVKIIKKGDLKKVEAPVELDKKTNQQVAREMVSTVSNWVNDFQKRQREETKQAIESFFGVKPQTNGV